MVADDSQAIARSSGRNALNSDALRTIHSAGSVCLHRPVAKPCITHTTCSNDRNWAGCGLAGLGRLAMLSRPLFSPFAAR